MGFTGKNLIIVTGPESTGKTTIAQFLANMYSADYYPEYAREYIQNLDRNYNYTDIHTIAEFQYKQFLEYQKKNKLSIFDTYLIITKIWFQWHSKTYPAWIDDALLKTRGALYLLCATDIDWIPDMVRENGGDARELLFEMYRKELESFGLDYRIITGNNELRLKNASEFVDIYLKQK
jgi:nicotinamide riboside kinase